MRDSRRITLRHAQIAKLRFSIGTFVEDPKVYSQACQLYRFYLGTMEYRCPDTGFYCRDHVETDPIQK